MKQEGEEGKGGLIALIRKELAAYDALLVNHHQQVQSLKRWAIRARPHYWGALDLTYLEEQEQEHDRWFTHRYLEPLERVRRDLRNPRWWHLIQECCMRRERWDHPRICPQHGSPNWSFIAAENTERASWVALFYSTVFSLLDERHDESAPFMEECYQRLERALSGLVK